MSRREGPHRFTENRPRSFVPAPRGFAAVGTPKNQLSPSFSVLFGFRLFNNIGARPSAKRRAERGLVMVRKALLTKARILEAVREAVSDEAADRMAQMKKQDMAEGAEQLLAATGLPPALMRTPRAAQGSTESPQADAVTEVKDLDAYAVAAE
jgi:hypothetical protein